MGLRCVGVMVLAVCSGLHGRPDGALDPVREARLPYLVAWAGRDTLAPGSVERIATQAAWERFWRAHTGAAAAEAPTGAIAPGVIVPEIDFSRCMVIAIVPGEVVRGYSVQLVEVEDRKADRVLRYDVLRYQSAMRLGDGNGAPPPPPPTHRPFGCFVIERTEKPLVLEENVQGLIGQPPVWKESHRIGAIE